jgi:hypothetical protein
LHTWNMKAMKCKCKDGSLIQILDWKVFDFFRNSHMPTHKYAKQKRREFE